MTVLVELAKAGLTQSTFTGFDAHFYKWAIVWDKQTNGAAMTGDLVYNTGTGNDQWLNFRNLENSTRFQVLKTGSGCMEYSNTYSDTAGTPAVHGDSNCVVMTFVKKLDIEVNCKGTGGAVSDISDNSLHFIFCPDQANKFNVAYKCRIRYIG